MSVSFLFSKLLSASSGIQNTEKYETRISRVQFVKLKFGLGKTHLERNSNAVLHINDKKKNILTLEREGEGKKGGGGGG